MEHETHHTYDYFNGGDLNRRMEALRYCQDKALNSGLVCEYANYDGLPALEMVGTKAQFIKYYFKTLLINGSVLKGIQRFINVLFW